MQGQACAQLREAQTIKTAGAGFMALQWVLSPAARSIAATRTVTVARAAMSTGAAAMIARARAWCRCAAWRGASRRTVMMRSGARGRFGVRARIRWWWPRVVARRVVTKTAIVKVWVTVVIAGFAIVVAGLIAVIRIRIGAGRIGDAASKQRCGKQGEGQAPDDNFHMGAHDGFLSSRA